MKYKNIAIPAQDTTSSEVFQRLALSHGYAWGSGSGVKVVDPLKWLVFNPNNKVISTCDKKDVGDATLTGNMADIVRLLNSPEPQNKVLVNSSKSVYAELTAAGGVKLQVGAAKLLVDREIIKLLADELGFSQKAVAPLVKFEYPETARGGLPKLRFVRVTSLDDTYLKGYEVEKPSSTAVGEFKNFVRNRILNGGTVELVKFSM